MHYTHIRSPFGQILLAGDSSGLRHIRFVSGKKRLTPHAEWKQDRAFFQEAAEQLQAYFKGNLRRFTLKLAPQGTPFQLKVLWAVQEIPYGQTTTYANLAKYLNKPKAYRAVGAANGHNPLPIVIPCHRVIGSDGRLTGYGAGLKTKQALLALERAHRPLGEGKSPGQYPCYDNLSQHETEGLDYRIQVREAPSPIAVMALHGGKIEPGTLELADAVAGKEHAFYAFEGKKPKGNGALHITSTSFDEPRALRLARKSAVVVALHGCEGMEEAVYLGGRHTSFKARIREQLQNKGFSVDETPQSSLRGTHFMNMCNRGQSGRGVQLEITYGLRKKMFTGLGRGRSKKRTGTFHAFVSALRDALS
jgi:methylated-DNA-[protein]-cysteine S-methyltransferase